MAEPEHADLTTLTVELLSAFVSNNSIDSADLARLIQTTHAALTGINAPPPVEAAAPEYPPAVSIRKSLGSRDHILSLIDGKPYKTLKRHLSGQGLTPSEYRERYNLPSDYPMVAPSYSDHRRDVARRLGLGRKPLHTMDDDAAAGTPSATSPGDPALAGTVTDGASEKAAVKPNKKASGTKATKPAAKRVAKVAAEPVTIADAPLADDAIDAANLPDVKSEKPLKKAAADASAPRPGSVRLAGAKAAPKAPGRPRSQKPSKAPEAAG